MSPSNEQVRLRSQPVSDLQPVACAQGAMDHDANFFSGSSTTEKGAILHRYAYVTINYISPEACPLPLAAEASAARCADDLDAGVMKLDVDVHGSTPHSTVGGL
jgi:hypothetical protein